MTRHTFKQSKEERFPIVGDLIRNTGDTGDFINIVLEVSDVKPAVCPGATSTSGREYVHVRSVRYGHTNHGDFVLLNGKRSRSIKMYKDKFCKWELVDEYVKADNAALRASIVKSLEGVDTAWQAAEEAE